MDEVPTIAEYKLLQLIQCLAGGALKTVDNHSAMVCDIAKEKLE